ncbi:hypothetical protein E8K88_03460 [Lampropedia aestuarii]|uniref:Uncharacterized protein n=1 Tax=Lampropedia aestuarii TaxID=2562762 RepID=A0A4S5BS60_9BURK|nr:hypothetical protein [Lampropedia aestuarii]THJ35654.1 hypothetical protein E8K88_03460 [Lampropedia aestuarii]
MTQTIEPRELLTSAELALYNDSLSEATLRKRTSAQLRRDLQRARQLRDKAQDTYRRQVGETRQRTGTKRGVHGTSNQRTREKAQILSATVVRLSEAAQQVAKAEQEQAKA